MGFSFSCFRPCSNSQRLANQQEKKHDNRSACSGLSFMGLGCLWKQETKQMQLKLEEKQQKEQLKKAKELTLEDWLINSPGILQKNHGVLGDEYHVFKHSSKRVFPSVVGEMANSSSKPKESFSKEKLLLKHDEDVESEAMEVCLSRSQSRKSKKRVSFRLPEEADIFIFHASSEEESGEKEICIL
ncbi:hypothetical protein DITRI_Ditri14bG0140600 [Diplodiscus trichospermus]